MKGCKFLIILPFLFLALVLFAQSRVEFSGGVPEDLLRPQYGETLRFPRDYVIGELGRGDAPEEAYQSARNLAAVLLRGEDLRQSIPLEEWNKSREIIGALDPRGFRIGGGRKEADGSVSFLVRFLGRESSVTGELYLRVNRKTKDAEANTGSGYLWQAEDLLLEAASPLSGGKYGPGFADMSVYERFF
jgi:hypothetical protein